MEMVSDFLTWFRVAGFLLFCAIALKSCSLEKNSKPCEEVRFERWTNEFIDRMRAGDLPEHADQLATRQSQIALEQCIMEHN